jgi:hypothetical protein
MGFPFPGQLLTFAFYGYEWFTFSVFLFLAERRWKKVDFRFGGMIQA